MDIKEKISRFLTGSLLIIVVLCITIFSLLSVYLQERSQQTVRSVGEIYLHKVNERLEMHYETMMDFYFSRMEVLADEVPARPGDTYETLDGQLAREAQALGFSHLALISADMQIDYVYGGRFDFPEPSLLVEQMSAARPLVRMGRDLDGNTVLLFSMNAAYPMRDGSTSVGLIGGIPDTHVIDILFLDQSEDLVSSFVILRDGTFVLDSSRYATSYFAEVMESYGAQSERQETAAERYVEELQAAMQDGRTLEAVYSDGAERLQVYATPLPHSRWYLVTELPFGQLDAAVNALGSDWMLYVVGGCLIILGAIVFVFLRYRALSSQQMEELTAARREAERANRVKSEFFSSMSHDIRTPMNAIVGMTAIASAHIDSPDVVKHSLEKISLSSKQLLGLINDVLDMSKIESGQLQFTMDEMELREFLESILAIIRPQIEAKQQELEVRTGEISAETVYCDSIRLSQVLLNLLNNASKYTQDGGRIELLIYEQPSAMGSDRVELNIVVRDNGIGMSDEFQKVVYDSFSRENTDRVRRTEGAGLGLSITKYIVEAMGGSIELQSQAGEGTEFRIRLDLEVCPTDTAAMQLPPWRVLIVDDDTDVGRMATAALTEFGAQPEWTFDGTSALENLTAAKREGRPFDVVLLDWKLPFMDGIQVARRMRSLTGDQTKIVLMSAYDWAEVEADAREVGICGFVAKPLFRSSLYRGLRKCMQTAEEQKVAVEPDFSGRRLLVAEDNALNWEITNALLGSRGFLLERAADGSAALERFERSPAGYYDGILMDVQMPVMDGRQATAAIRALDRTDAATIPIIAMTADAFSSDVKQCLDAGMNAHIAKPIDMNEVVRVLSRFFA
ncbi:MAG: response regulator [Clostridia bacterium]|nr:response regulator [Clostridia bacterium]